jgi:hypothetical protein
LVKAGGNNPKATILSTGTTTELETKSKRWYVSHFLAISVKPSFLKIPFSYLGTIALSFLFCIAFMQEILFRFLKGFKSADLSIENTKAAKEHEKCNWYFLFICPVESDLMLF